MEKESSDIKETLKQIKDSINDKNNSINTNDEYILLDKIVSKKKSLKINRTERVLPKKNDDNIKAYTAGKSSELKKNIKNEKKKTINKENSSKNISKDPVAALVDREIKPIIKKWISKNLKSFVKTIVIEEMKLISKATQKHK
ncbi:MAG: hypothetical protein CMP36_02680 [Rickettsiales bacterium]|nr:hypothetical protein [Rickettsiales bacterium]OUV79812.1 MAG: hypothetical protein CBC91_03365 [Rickettsiales bacterium TMED131]|tara:strand:+ start:747 stop:1175 length:429 start_codon:yes stop_codon:yes gene_type:complete